MANPTKWYDLNNTDKSEYRKHIHPSGNISEEAYLNSSLHIASILQDKIIANSVLEYGCGDGRIMRHLKYNKLYGVDIVPSFVKDQENCYLLNQFDKQIEAIYSITVFIHLSKVESITALDWIYSHLLPGGKAYLDIPIYTSNKNPGTFCDVGVWSIHTFVEAMNIVGFKIIEVYTNPIEFSFENIGLNHNAIQVIQK